jgi:hypothetical protein
MDLIMGSKGEQKVVYNLINQITVDKIIINNVTHDNVYRQFNLSCSVWETRFHFLTSEIQLLINKILTRFTPIHKIKN